MTIKRQEVLAKRSSYLSVNPDAFKGNSNKRNEYINFMLSNNYTLSDYQISVCIGLLLSDSCFDVNFNNKAARLKTQQKTGHKEWLVNVKKCLLEFTASDKGIGRTAESRNTIELDTLKCPYFFDLIQYFHSKDSINYRNLGAKGIMPSIKPWINPVTVANWFCGDGGKADFTKNKGKGITFNTQGFKKEECQILCDALLQNLGIESSVKKDSSSPEQYRIDTAGSSYDRFIEIVGPYIDPCFKSKLPTPRVAQSRWGYMTSDLFETCLSSKLTIPGIVENWKP